MATFRRREKTPGFGEGMAQTFAPMAQDVWMTTLRDLLSKPERRQEMAARTQAMQLGLSAEDRATADQRLQEELQPYKISTEKAKRAAYETLGGRTPGAMTPAEKQKRLTDIDKMLMKPTDQLATLLGVGEEEAAAHKELLSREGNQLRKELNRPLPKTKPTTTTLGGGGGKENPEDIVQVNWNGNQFPVKRKNLKKALADGAALIK